jgi:predicted transcriptional regulator
MGSGIKFVGIIFVDAGKMLKEFGRQAEWMFNLVKEFDISVFFAKIAMNIKSSIADMLQTLLNMSGPVAKFFGISQDTLKSQIDKMRGEVSIANAKFADDQKKHTEEIAKQTTAAATNAIKANVTPETTTQTGASPVAQQTQIDVQALMSQKKTLEENLKSLTEFASAGVIKSISESIPKASTAITDFNDKLSKSSIENTISVTQGVVKSINDLNMILGDGNAGSIKVGEKLQRFANNSGLGKNGTYEIKNKGIQLKLDLKITMDAGEVEKAILERKDSIIFDILDDNSLTPANQQKVREMTARKGGG